jgi:hypothetical protein
LTATYNRIEHEARDEKWGVILEVTLSIRSSEAELISENQWRLLDRRIRRNVRDALSHYVLQIADTQRRSRFKKEG